MNSDIKLLARLYKSTTEEAIEWIRSHPNDKSIAVTSKVKKIYYGYGGRGTGSSEYDIEIKNDGIYIRDGEGADTNKYTYSAIVRELKAYMESESCDHPEAKNDFPCDNCGYDEKGCCNYPETPDDFCVMGDKQVPVTKKHIEKSDKYVEAVQLNAHIITSARAAQQNLYDMAVGFKKMRDDKLYKELGYDNFGDYCEAETGMTRVNVYNYISIVEKLPNDFVKSTLQIGKEKLYLLSTVEESQRTEIVEKTDLESTTVRELKKQIEQLKKSEENSKAELAQVKEELEESRDYADKSEERAAYAENKVTEISVKKYELEKRVKELESRPIDVAVDVDEVNRRVEEALQKVNSENAHLLAEERSEFAKTINAKDDKIWELEDKLKALEDKPQKYVKKIFAFAMTMDTYSKLIELIKKSKDTDLSKALSGAKIIDLNGKEV